MKRTQQQPSISVNELDADLRKALGLKKAPTRRAIPMEQVRARALDVLAEISNLTQQDRRRVLEQALKANEV